MILARNHGLMPRCIMQTMDIMRKQVNNLHCGFFAAVFCSLEITLGRTTAGNTFEIRFTRIESEFFSDIESNTLMRHITI